MAKTTFLLGGVVDPKTGDRSGDLVRYDADDLTTHGVIVGMTGSGKTGLGVIFLEEALRNGIPTLVIDPKGDMTNLLLTFPDLTAADFEPWVDADEARKEDTTTGGLAARTADSWKKGLASWDLSGADIAALRARAGFTIYTPGSSAGVPLNILGSMASPGVDWEKEAETARDEVEGLVSGLLSLVGITADPLSGREHILLSNIVEAAWRADEDLTLEDLIARVHRPPMRKLGVFDIDTFFPEKDRLALAMRLNTLVASPSFSEWRAGEPVDPQRLFWDDTGKPQAAIVYLAHLSDDERQFVVTTLLSRLVTWMRSQPGTSDLRALVYMDEVFGFVPPTAMPPAKKPILTLLKTARAFGVGILLATQNPVDLDYKAMSNAGTWCIGRLQTERDKARILEALQSAAGDVDMKTLDATISGLEKRRFVMHNTHGPGPTVFTTRWAMSYLRGPLTRDQITMLVGERSFAPKPSRPPAAPVDADATAMAPDAPEGVAVRYLDPAAAWAERVGAARSSTRFAAGMAARVHLTFDDTNAGVDHDEIWEAVYFPLGDPFDPATATAVDYDDRDLRSDPPAGATYVIPAAPIAAKAYYSAAARAIADLLYRDRSVEVYRNSSLKLFSRVGEAREEFVARCRTAAEDAADAEVAAVHDKLAARIDKAKDEIRAAYQRVEDARLDLDTRRQEEMLSGAGTLIGVLMGRKRTSAISTASSKRSMTRRAEQRVAAAEQRTAKEQTDVDRLEADMADAVADITAKLIARAETVEAIEVGLEKTDIQVEPPVLVWIPVR
ncbi:MAG: hypothetical protein A2Z12_07545 [Actinobacteria bacterium RBG_16_68_21]|nr:MAG: hypothetical protein A2Z12_07545 [Actinobacteria bacterium RBG_16_68_21]